MLFVHLSSLTVSLADRNPASMVPRQALHGRGCSFFLAMGEWDELIHLFAPKTQCGGRVVGAFLRKQVSRILTYYYSAIMFSVAEQVWRGKRYIWELRAMFSVHLRVKSN